MLEPGTYTVLVTAPAVAGGGGLSGLADRVRAVGGELAVTAPPGGGTVIEARLPVG